MAEPSVHPVDKPFVNHYDQNAVDPSYGDRPLELLERNRDERTGRDARWHALDEAAIAAIPVG
jgi:hypothetical protein